MKLKTTTLVILAAALMAFTVAGDNGKIVRAKEFQKYIDPIGLQFTLPAGYTEAPVKENGDLMYDFAMKNTAADFEVRYSVWSLTPVIKEYEACKADPKCTMVSPNVIYKGRAQANVLNMTGGLSSEIGGFPLQAVKKEFNADDGGSSFFELNCGFGKGYKYGQMAVIHKDNVADVIITFMSNDKGVHTGNMEKVFHALTFK